MKTLCFAILAMSGQFQAQNTTGSNSTEPTVNSSALILPGSDNHTFSKENNITKLITFNGSGCSSAESVTINATEWDVNMDFSKFSAEAGKESVCELSIPLDLHGGCLVELLQSATISGQADAQVNMTFNGAQRNWCTRQQIQGQSSGQGNGFLYSGPAPAICGYGTRINLAIALQAKKAADSSGGTFKNFMIKLVNICNVDFCGNITCSSDADKINAQWLYFFLPLIVAVTNQ